MKYLSNKSRRFMRKMMTGFNCHWGEKARMFVLTESNEAIAKGYDFRLKFQHLMAYLRKKTGLMTYCCVIHRQGDKKRINAHVIYFGSYINQEIVENWWWANYESHMSKFEQVKYEEKTAFYLCKYVGGDEKFVKAQFSKNWVFPRWWAFGQWYKKQFGGYPNIEILKSYKSKTKEDLLNDEFYSQFVKDTKVKKKETVSQWLARIKKKEFYKKLEGK